MFWIFSHSSFMRVKSTEPLVYRSALSAVLPLIDGHKAGSHPLVCQLLEGVFQLRPPQPRYATTWQVSKVVQYISSLGSNSNLSTKLLSYKLVGLLALTAPDRASGLQPVIYALDTFTLREFSLNSRNWPKLPDKATIQSLVFMLQPRTKLLDISIQFSISCHGTIVSKSKHFCQGGCKKIGIPVMCLNRFCPRL